MLVSLVCKSQNTLLLAHSKTCIHHKNYAKNLKRPSNIPDGYSVDRAVGVCKPERKKGQEAEVLKGQEVGATEKKFRSWEEKNVWETGEEGVGYLQPNLTPYPFAQVYSKKMGRYK